MQKITAALLIMGTLGMEDRNKPRTDGLRLRTTSTPLIPTYRKQDPITYTTAADYIANNSKTQHLITLDGAIKRNTISDNEAKTNISDIKYNKYSDSIYINDYSSGVNDNKYIKDPIYINDYICGVNDNKYIKDSTYINDYSCYNIDNLKKLYDNLTAATSIPQALNQYKKLKAKMTKPHIQCYTGIYLLDLGEETSTPIENGEVIQAAMDLLAKVNATDLDDLTKYIILKTLKDLIKIDAKRFNEIKFRESTSTILPVIQRITNALGHAVDDIFRELGQDEDLQKLNRELIAALQDYHRAPRAPDAPTREQANRHYQSILKKHTEMKKSKLRTLADKTIATLGMKLLEEANKIIKEELNEEEEPRICSDEEDEEILLQKMQ